LKNSFKNGISPQNPKFPKEPILGFFGIFWIFWDFRGEKRIFDGLSGENSQILRQTPDCYVPTIFRGERLHEEPLAASALAATEAAAPSARAFELGRRLRGRWQEPEEVTIQQLLPALLQRAWLGPQPQRWALQE